MVESVPFTSANIKICKLIFIVKLCKVCLFGQFFTRNKARIWSLLANSRCAHLTMFFLWGNFLGPPKMVPKHQQYTILRDNLGEGKLRLNGRTKTVVRAFGSGHCCLLIGLVVVAKMSIISCKPNITVTSPSNIVKRVTRHAKRDTAFRRKRQQNYNDQKKWQPYARPIAVQTFISLWSGGS